MKPKVRIFALIGLLATGTLAPAQSSTWVCHGDATTITAVNNASLSNPSYSMNPGGVTSSNPIFTVAPVTATTYTLYVTGTNSNSAVVTTSNTVAVTVFSVSYSVVSTPPSFTLGCSTKSMIVVTATNAQTQPILGGSVSYSFVPPGGMAVPSNTSLSVANNVSVSTPGTWTAVVRDNANYCTIMTPFTVTSNTMGPTLNPISYVPSQVLNCTNTSMVLSTQTVSNLSYQWSTPLGITSGHSLTVTSNTSAPASSLVLNATLTVTDNNNLCRSMTITPVRQNLYPPTAHIATGGSTLCATNSLVLTNQSTTGIPPGSPFSTSAAVVSSWQGPSPQVPASLSSTYIAYTAGDYTMSVVDNNNGCTDDATVTVNIITAAFSHTIALGTATFNSLATGVFSSTAFYWDFGDGSYSTSQNPIHTYLNGGAHLVKLKVSSGSFCADSVIQSVNITGVICNANSNFSLTPTSTAQIWNAIPAYPWNVSAAIWDWGDNSTSNVLYTSHQYSAAGMYNICLSVTVSCVASSSSCASYSVFKSSQAANIVQVNVINPGLVSRIIEKVPVGDFAWSVVPNPGSGSFKIVFSEVSQTPMRILVSDLTGRTVYTTSLSTSEEGVYGIELTHIPDGIYLVTVDSGAQKTTKKLIVSR
jgi:PKD repeat protein